MKKAVAHLIPFMEEEKRQMIEQMANGDECGEMMVNILFFTKLIGSPLNRETSSLQWLVFVVYREPLVVFT